MENTELPSGLLHVNGEAEEWLRRIAVGRSLANVPDGIAFALAAMGFVQRTGAASFEATPNGRAHLEARGIAHMASHRDRAPKRRFG
jgi:hypothetical protein